MLLLIPKGNFLFGFICRYPLSEFLWAHCDGGHRPRFSSLLWHPRPEIPGEPFEPSWWLPEVPRRWHPQTHYRERLAGTYIFFLPLFLSLVNNYLGNCGLTWMMLDDSERWVVFSYFFSPLLSPTHPPPSLPLSLSLSDSSTLLSESRWDVEKLLFWHSFLPQRGVHPLLWRFWHQAVCSRWTALFRPARQLRRTVELVSSFPPLLYHYVLVQIFTSQSLHPSSSSSLVTSLSLLFYLLI